MEFKVVEFGVPQNIDRSVPSLDRGVLISSKSHGSPFV